MQGQQDSQRARYRGLSKVRIQFFMIAIALNCKRAILAAVSHLLRLLLLMIVRIENLTIPITDLRQKLNTRLQHYRAEKIRSNRLDSAI